jgi:hypothetical protein
LLLLEGDDVRQDSAVKHELHVLGGVAGGGVLPDDGEEEWLVSEVLGPEGENPLGPVQAGILF